MPERLRPSSEDGEVLVVVIAALARTNAERRSLAKCVAAVSRQSRPPEALIVVDDGAVRPLTGLDTQVRERWREREFGLKRERERAGQVQTEEEKKKEGRKTFFFFRGKADSSLAFLRPSSCDLLLPSSSFLFLRPRPSFSLSL